MTFYTDTPAARTYATASAATRDFAQAVMGKLSELRDATALRRAKSRAYRTTMNELAVLSRRDLADLGIARSEIRRIAQEAADNVTAL